MSENSLPHRPVLDVIRFVLEIFTIASLAFWGFIVWPFPWNIAVGLALPLLALLLWALFRSPKAVFSIDPYGKSLIELLVVGSVVFAWWHLGAPAVSVTFGIVASVCGVIAGMRELA